jgi:hypothetical protein
MRESQKRRQILVIGSALVVVATSVGALLVSRTEARQSQARQFSLESTAGLRLSKLTAQPATLGGKKGVQVTSTGTEEIAAVEGLDFDNGIIQVELAGTPGPGAGEGARGFVGIAFRVSNDMQTFDAFYLRPTNGRAEDQERRNHAAQYISHPDWPWFRLRKETPSRYESYVDLVPNEWTRMKIDVQGTRAHLYIHEQQQPTLVVTDLKTGAQGRGGVGLWVGSGTVAHFRNLSVQPSKGAVPKQ